MGPTDVLDDFEETEKIYILLGFETRIAEPIAQSLYRLRYVSQNYGECLPLLIKIFKTEQA